MRTLAEKILSLFSKNYFVYKVSQKIVSFHNNENNPNFASNGESVFLKNYARNAKVIFDVGANVGTWTRLAHAYSPEAEIYAFEPFAQAFNELSAMPFSDTVHYYNVALGNAPEKKNLFTYVESSAFNSLYPRQLGIETSSVSVDVTTVDLFCAAHAIQSIDFLKIDVEGAELAVLQGAHDMIAQGRIKVVQFEYGGTYIDAHILLKDVFEFFAHTPYQLYKVFPEQIVPLTQYDPGLENFQYANYAALLKI